MQRAIDPQLFKWPDAEPHLLGSECRSCGTVNFPSQQSCPSCCGVDVVQRHLGRHGKLWTWTTQAFAPKSPPYHLTRDPTAFVPYRLGYVELPGETIVESRIAGNADVALEIGMLMVLVFAPLFVDGEGNEVVSFAFEPMRESAA